MMEKKEKKKRKSKKIIVKIPEQSWGHSLIACNAVTTAKSTAKGPQNGLPDLETGLILRLLGAWNNFC